MSATEDDTEQVEYRQFDNPFNVYTLKMSQRGSQAVVDGLDTNTNELLSQKNDATLLSSQDTADLKSKGTRHSQDAGTIVSKCARFSQDAGELGGIYNENNSIEQNSHTNAQSQLDPEQSLDPVHKGFSKIAQTNGSIIIDSIMKPPKMMNYEQLKRPKTNRGDLPRNNLANNIETANSL